MNQKWLDAARKYQQRNEEKTQRQAATTLSSVQPDQATKEQRKAAIANAAQQLEHFLVSHDGRAALALLKASGRHLIFGEERGGGYAVVDFIDGEGLHKSHERHGMYLVYSANKNPESKISPITAHDAIRSAIFSEFGSGCKNPEDVLPWLRNELDKIAEAIN